MTELLQFALFGLMLGCIYAIAAMGLVLTYTVTGIFNFSHGAIGMLCAFLFYQLRVESGLSTWVALLLVVVLFAPVLGLLLERLLRPFSDVDPATSLVVTVALTVGLLGVAQALFDQSVARRLPPLLGDNQIRIADVPVSYDQIAQVVVALAVAFGLRYLLFRRRLGAQMRSVVDDPDLARLNGVNPVAVARASWAISAALGGLAGVLFAGGQNLQAILLTFLVVNAYAAAMIGRLKSLPMTFAGALLLGLAEELTNVSYLWPDGELFTRIRLAIPGLFLVAAVALIPSIRLTAGRVTGREQPRVPTVTRSVAAGAAFIAAVWLLVQILPEADRVHVVRALVIAVVSLSLVALTGLSGQVSLMQYLFLGVGTFVAATTFSGNGVLGMLAGGFASMGLGMVVALPSLRLKGLHFALSTFGIALVGRDVILADSRVFGIEGRSVARPTVFGLSTQSDGAFAVWCAVVFVVLSVALVALRRSWVGRHLAGMRDSELGAATLGMNVRLTKILVIGLAGLIAGCAGSLFGGFQGVVGATQLEPVNNLLVLLFAFVGGVTTMTGAVLAGALLSLLTFVQAEVPELAGLVFVAIGAAAIALGRQPNGIAGLIFARWDNRKSRSPDGRAGLDSSEYSPATGSWARPSAAQSDPPVAVKESV